MLINAERLIHTIQEEVCEANKVWCSECPFWRQRGGECLIENHIREVAAKTNSIEESRAESITNGWIYG